MMTRPVLLIPGIYNSGPRHWQSLWQNRYPGVARVAQEDWDHPDCDTWVRTLDEAIARAQDDVDKAMEPTPAPTAEATAAS